MRHALCFYGISRRVFFCNPIASTAWCKSGMRGASSEGVRTVAHIPILITACQGALYVALFVAPIGSENYRKIDYRLIPVRKWSRSEPVSDAETFIHGDLYVALHVSPIRYKTEYRKNRNNRILIEWSTSFRWVLLRNVVIGRWWVVKHPVVLKMQY